jgi:hypothetical protein
MDYEKRRTFTKLLSRRVENRITYHRTQSFFLLLASFILTFLSGPLAYFAPGSPLQGQALASTYLNAYSAEHLSRNLPRALHNQAWEPLLSDTTLSSINVSSGVTLSTEMLRTGAGFIRVCTLDVDLTSPHVRLGIVQAHDRLVSSDETVSSMADRTGAVAGVNGDFFEINGPGRPIGMMEINGRLLQSPTYYAVLGITQSGNLTIHSESFAGNVTDGEASYPLNAVNIYNNASKGKMVLLTPDLGVPPPIWGNSAVLLQPVDASAGTFSVRSILPVVSLSALAGQYALVGGSSAARWIIAHLHRRDRINVQENISPDGDLY